MFALQPGAAGAAMTEWVRTHETPRAIVVISPHWETPVPVVGCATRLSTVHDFGGFDPRLFQIQYPAQGQPLLAQRVQGLLQAAGLPALLDPAQGLDHGAWVPLRQMYPKADVPVVPLSIQHHGGPAHAHRVGQALAPLREEGVLIVASGNITHNLRDWHVARSGASIDIAYVARFADWVNDTLTHKDIDALLDYRSNRDDGRRAHPRDDHFLPLFTAIGAAGSEAQPEAFHRSISERVIAMDGYRFH